MDLLENTIRVEVHHGIRHYTIPSGAEHILVWYGKLILVEPIDYVVENNTLVFAQDLADVFEEGEFIVVNFHLNPLLKTKLGKELF